MFDDPHLLLMWNRCTLLPVPSVQLELPGSLTAKTDFVVAPVGDDVLSFDRRLRQGVRFNLSLENGRIMSKDHRCIPLYLEKNSLRMRALASDGNHVAAAVDAQGQESSSTAMADTAKPNPAPLVIDDQGCTSPVEAMRARLRELGHETSALASSG